MLEPGVFSMWLGGGVTGGGVLVESDIFCVVFIHLGILRGLVLGMLYALSQKGVRF